MFRQAVGFAVIVHLIVIVACYSVVTTIANATIASGCRVQYVALVRGFDLNGFQEILF